MLAGDTLKTREKVLQCRADMTVSQSPIKGLKVHYLYNLSFCKWPVGGEEVTAALILTDRQTDRQVTETYRKVRGNTLSVKQEMAANNLRSAFSPTGNCSI